MEKELWIGQMEINIAGNGKMTKGMKKELWIG